MIKQIGTELIRHAPFTAIGATIGIVIMLIIIFANALPQVSQVSHTLFYIFHPLHVVLSAGGVITSGAFQNNRSAPLRGCAAIRRIRTCCGLEKKNHLIYAIQI